MINVDSDANAMQRFIAVQSEQDGQQIYQINPAQTQSGQQSGNPQQPIRLFAIVTHYLDRCTIKIN